MPTRRAARSTGLVGQQLQPPHLRTCVLSSLPQARCGVGPPLPSCENGGLWHGHTETCRVTLPPGEEATVPRAQTEPAPSSAFIYLWL